jgi:hypothetical protein
MQITVPAESCGTAAPVSVLDLEPIIDFARQCCPDAVSLGPPMGADDQPNAAALIAMRHRLEAEGLGVIGGTWRVPDAAAASSGSRQAENAYEARTLIAALGEAGVGLLPVEWCVQPDGEAQAAVAQFLSDVAAEAERAGVRIAARLPGAPHAASDLLRRLSLPSVGLCWDAPVHSPTLVEETLGLIGDRLLAVRVPAAREPAALYAGGWRRLTEVLRESGFSGPVLVGGSRGPETAFTVGVLRGLLAG